MLQANENLTNPFLNCKVLWCETGMSVNSAKLEYSGLTRFPASDADNYHGELGYPGTISISVFWGGTIMITTDKTGGCGYVGNELHPCGFGAVFDGLFDAGSGCL